MSRPDPVRTALATIADVLAAPRDRLGRLEFYAPEAREARERLRCLALAYQVPGAHDVLEQAWLVARAVLRARKRHHRSGSLVENIR